MDRLYYARVCVEVKLDAVLPTKILLSKRSTNEEESVVEVEVELPGELSRSSRGGYNSALCKTLSVSRPMGRNLESKVTPIPPIMVKPNGFQRNAPGNASDMCQSDAVMSSEVPGEMECNQVDCDFEKQSVKPYEQVPCLDWPELGSATDGVCNEAAVFRVVLDSNLMPQNKAPNERVVLDAFFDPVMPVVADEVPVVAGPKLAPFPVGKDRVGKENDAPLPYLAPCTLSTPLDIMHQINHCPQGGLGVDGMKPVSMLSNVDGNIASSVEFIKHGANENKPVRVVPLFIQDPASSRLAENHQLDDLHLADAVIDESLAADSSPSPHAASADQHGKAPGSAQLALIFHQEMQQASFAEVLRRGLVAAVEGLLGSLDVISSVQTILSLSQGGVSGPCSNLQQPNDSAAIAIPSASVRVVSAEGFVLKSILKKSRRPKQKWSPRSANHV
ncbi:hypothetical protein Nepgr_018028 [Nepenthes gracilis]|uniref:Uncharacterized protein n=1 Tax=Nepenthes gracilis TaxID=150966 RepID=A0AAD3STD7_NEPGR|nr:hypothetical protein Nepgr_018028 [Nepenthes gracilis]